MSRLGEELIKAGLITDAQLRKALDMQKKGGGRIGYNLVKLGYIDEEEITSFLSKQYGVPSINLSHFDIDENVINLIREEDAQKYQLIPVNRTGSILTIAMSDPSNVFALDDIKFMTGFNVEPVVASESSIRASIDKYYGSSNVLAEVIEDIEEEMLEIVEEEESEIDIGDLQAQTSEAPVVRLVNLVLQEAVKKGVSDIHLEPYEKEFRIRYRLDGDMFQFMTPPLKLKDAITSRVKILAKLDIAEKRLPQDGRIKIRVLRKDVDLRVSTLPVMHGEKIVMRILDKSNLMLDLSKLGFHQKGIDDFQSSIAKPYGMVLVTGPTGSGKTTTLYSALDQLNVIEKNIMTAEDPVEFNIRGINQVQMKEAIGLNFASALRSFLRQDPDIIMVGEIRDFETAEIAVKAALTGHLVLSTLHTNDAPSTVNRLLNMGVEPFLVSSSVLLILAQRLVKTICKECKEEVEAPPTESLINLGFSKEEIPNIKFYKGAGCSACNDTGYKGRIAVYEVMPITDEIKEAILSGQSSLEIRELARQKGMLTLREAGMQKIREGATTLEKVLEVTLK